MHLTHNIRIAAVDGNIFSTYSCADFLWIRLKHLKETWLLFSTQNTQEFFSPTFSSSLSRGLPSAVTHMWVCVCDRSRGRNMETDIVYVHVSACLPRVTAVCQGLCSLVQMAQPVAPRVPRLPALIDQGRGSHGLGARGLIGVAWPLGPLGPPRGSEVAQPWQPRQ